MTPLPNPSTPARTATLRNNGGRTFSHLGPGPVDVRVDNCFNDFHNPIALLGSQCCCLAKIIENEADAVTGRRRITI